MRVIRVSEYGIEAALAVAAKVINEGGLVIYPTETFYAVGANALDPDAVGRVFAAKGRSEGKPLPVILGDKALLGEYIFKADQIAIKAIERLMPGPVTIIFHAKAVFPAITTAGTGKIAIRIPRQDIAAGLSRACRLPITATSANRSGKPGITAAQAAFRAFMGRVDLLLDGGITPGSPATTLLDVTTHPPRVLRAGPPGDEALARYLREVSGMAETSEIS